MSHAAAQNLGFRGDNSVNMAAASGSVDAITTLLEVAPDLDISRALHSAVILQGGSSAVVVSLVEAMADVDGPYKPSGGIVALVNRVKGRADDTLLKAAQRWITSLVQPQDFRGPPPLPSLAIPGPQVFNFNMGNTRCSGAWRITARAPRHYCWQ